MSPEPSPVAASAERQSSPRRWGFRLVAILTPFLLLGGVEAGLRLSGHYRPTAFWVPTGVAGELMPNPQFANRFVGPLLARMPRSGRVSERPPEQTLRVLVFGESAAMGDPEPAFGVSRFLEVLLAARLPERRVEVINTAITALNSHAIRAAARDSRRLQADFWIVYAGNNEVIGPFGPSAVPNGRPPGLLVVRLGLWLRETAIGQWLTARQGGTADGLSLTQRWAGLEQFLDRQVPASDPRLPAVREIFGQNLTETVKAGLDSGARVLLSTMAVNLVDSAPFASVGMGSTNDPAFRAWAAAAEAGRAADERGAWPEAVAAWTNAAALRSNHAETSYRLGLTRLNAGDAAGGRRELEQARDLDTLRFRADSGINDVTRTVAGALKSDRLHFVDADRDLRGTDADRPPGMDLFFEHVHLRPDGNYRLAVLFAEQVVRGLGNPPGPKNWLSYDACLERLGWNPVAEARLWSQVRALCQRPPFAQQSNAELRDRFLDDRVAEATRDVRALGLPAAIERVQTAVKLRPDDWNLREQLARLFQASRQWSNAATELRRVVALAPAHVVGWYQLGETLAQAGDRTGAQQAYEQALAIRGDFVEASLGLGLVLGESGKLDAALKSIDTALAYSPRHLQARVNRGITLNALGRHGDAAAEWRRAASENPTATLPLIRLGEALSARKEHAAAADAFLEASRREPGNAALVHRLATELSRAGRPADAVAAFQRAVKLQPNFVAARLDLGVALAQQARFTEAIPEFEAALQVQPTNALALKYLQLAREKLGQTGVR